MAAYSQENLSDKVRHFYDLVVLYRAGEIQQFISSDEEFDNMMSITIQNDIDHTGSQKACWVNEDMSKNGPFSSFNSSWTKVESAYNSDFQMMITREEP